MSRNSIWSRRSLIKAGASAGLLLGLPAITRAADTLEKAKITVGMSTAGFDYFPVYVAASETWKGQGLTGEITAFRSDAEVAQALAGGSIDIAAASMNGLVTLIAAGQPVKGFYAGMNQANFEWYGQPATKSFADLKGKLVGTGNPGSLTDSLTRYVLKTHGLDPAKDVQFTGSGGAPSSYQALKSKRLDLVILSPPFKWRAKDEGFSLMASQTHDVANGWPKVVYIAREDFIANNPNTLHAFLRAHVQAIRLAGSDPARAAKVMVREIKYDESSAQRALTESLVDCDERGNLPTQAMPVFWQIAIDNHDVDNAWPEEKYLDRRFIDSFQTWAPS
jgi:NitT/TauT family transport system substrate-binding protein